MLAIALIGLLPEPWIHTIINGGAYLGIAIVIAVAVFAVTRQPGRHSLRRLRPEVAAAGAAAGRRTQEAHG